MVLSNRLGFPSYKYFVQVPLGTNWLVGGPCVCLYVYSFLLCLAYGLAYISGNYVSPDVFATSIDGAVVLVSRAVFGQG